MISSVNVEMVLIVPDKVEETVDGGVIVAPEVAREKLMKKQNRGTVEKAGDNCVWVKKGDIVSFYRAAATEITEDGIDYLLINEAHILAKFKK